ncbi:MAG: TrmH family RNA methyltransferase [Pirellula sp.]|jgi:tRNA G18 (ribose-2'-O)-methylase SpoU|nr:TrmH family RNA methyltransferase [Pirellula sp.]
MRFEHIRHKPPTPLDRERELVIALAPMRSNVNLSRIVRLCGCAGIRRIIQCGSGKVDREIARDAADYVEVIQRRSLAPAMEQLARDGYSMVGLEQTTNSVCLFEFPFHRKTALIVGSEREGLSSEELAILHHVIEIPVYGQPASYNVATATTMAVYEYCRQFPNG